ncbi:arginase family protein [Vibrio hepatarius]|uniref:arginase family protein n=1 Tax=Vibrio hepatarius TaxID=171383 RepID=UPI00142E1FD4|nr:arginase family protein [Vibrio hepatarius]NIY84113.1 arginase [Vibrio hepatarius]NVJ58248.1 arginase family protein [Vibrionaceae bacterium]
MFGLFRRNKTENIIGLPSHQLTLISVSEQLKSMKLVDFEMADQSLEEVYEWLSQQDRHHWLNGGHFNLKQQPSSKFQLHLSRLLGSDSLPVVLTNNVETLLHSLPLLHTPRRELGIIHIGRRFELKAPLEPDIGSAYHFALSRYNECRLFCIGIDNSQNDERSIEYAEDLGCDWMTMQECGFSHRFHVKQQIASYLSHCEDVVVNIDLECLYPSARIESASWLEVQMVSRMLRQLLISGKVRHIQLVGYKDKHLYSKQTLNLLHDMAEMFPVNHRAA